MISLGTGLWRGQAASFTPLSLSPSIWLDASSTLYQSNGGSTAVADGDPVGYWPDLSGNGYHFSQTDPTKKPLLKTAIKNGRNVVRLDGVNDYINNTSFTSSSASFWIFAAYKVNNVATQYVWDSITGFRPVFLYDGGNLNYGANYKAQTVPDTAIIAINYKANPNVVYRNNLQITGLNGSAVTPSSTTGIVIGSYFNMNAYFTSGDIYEYIRFPSTLSAQSISDLFTYLNAKWGVY